MNMNETKMPIVGKDEGCLVNVMNCLSEITAKKITKAIPKGKYRKAPAMTQVTCDKIKKWDMVFKYFQTIYV